MSTVGTKLSTADLLIIGGGFGACCAIAWLARHCRPSISVTLLASDEGLGCGLAYSGRPNEHLLNAHHSNLGLLESEKTGFTEWLSKRHVDRQIPPFAHRSTYGAFLQDQWRLNLGALMAKGATVNVYPRFGTRIEAIAKHEVIIRDDCGDSYSAKAVLVCEGPRLMRDTNVVHPRFISPIWPDGLDRLAGASGHVVVLGSGLSGIDAALSALAERDVSQVTIISRHGRLPKGHLPIKQPLPDLLFAGAPIDVVKQLRTAARSIPWQSVMNALRVQSNRLWQSWSVGQRKCALLRLGPLWAVHRNRAPQEVLDRLESALKAGRLRIVSALAEVRLADNFGLELRLLPSCDLIHPDWVVDARGFAKVQSNLDSFCGRAAQDGHFKVSDLGYGISASEHHRATQPVSAAIHVVGAARLGDLIETTGVPEVRAQVHQSLEAIFKSD